MFRPDCDDTVLYAAEYAEYHNALDSQWLQWRDSANQPEWLAAFHKAQQSAANRSLSGDSPYTLFDYINWHLGYYYLYYSRYSSADPIKLARIRHLQTITGNAAQKLSSQRNHN
jgi:hypothetical protein